MTEKRVVKGTFSHSGCLSIARHHDEIGVIGVMSHQPEGYAVCGLRINHSDIW